MLAIIGIGIGIATIIALGAITEGMISSADDTLRAGGSDFTVSGKVEGESSQMVGFGTSSFDDDYVDNLVVEAYDSYLDEIKKYHPTATDYSLRVDPVGNLWIMSRSYDLFMLDKDKHLTVGLRDCMAKLGVDMAKLPAQELVIWDVLFEPKGFIWIATDHFGLIVIDPRSKEVRQFISTKGDETSLNDITVKQIYRDQEGRVWISSYKNGINEYHKSQSNFFHLDLGDINAICEDQQGNWWLGTNDKGIIRYNPAKRFPQQRHRTCLLCKERRPVVWNLRGWTVALPRRTLDELPLQRPGRRSAKQQRLERHRGPEG